MRINELQGKDTAESGANEKVGSIGAEARELLNEGADNGVENPHESEKVFFKRNEEAFFAMCQKYYEDENRKYEEDCLKELYERVGRYK